MQNPIFETSTPSEASWGLAEDFTVISEAFSKAREDAVTSNEHPISNGVASLLTFFARALDASAVVEIGTGAGISGLAFFAGMNPAGILTSIDPDNGTQLAARSLFTDNDIPTNRFRLIAGVPLEVVDKLRDGAYDIVFINGDKLEYVEYLAAALRLLRHGGLVILNDALWHNLIADEDNEDDETVIIREALEAVSEEESYTPVLLPVGGGVLAAIKK